MAELAYKDEARYEKINGQWIMMSPARAEHVITVGNIYSEFRQYLKGKRCIPFTDGVVYILDEKEENLPEILVKGGVRDTVSCAYKEPFHYLDTEGKALDKVEKKIVLKEAVLAPVTKGAKAGEIQYYLDGEKIGSVAIVFCENIEKAGYWDYVKEIGEKIF